MEELALIAFCIIPLFFGTIEGFSLRRFIKLWYNKLILPRFTPPNRAYPFVFKLIYLLVGLSGYFFWKQEKSFSSKYVFTWSIYFIQLFFLYLWPIVFFYFQRLLLSLVIQIIFIILILSNAYLFFQIDSTAGVLLLIYAILIGGSLYFTFQVWRLNRIPNSVLLSENKNLVDSNVLSSINPIV